METEKPKRTRQMTPELIAKLAEARKKALEIKQKLKEGGDKAKLEHYQEKLKKLSIKKEKGTKVADNCLPLKPQEEEPIKPQEEEPIKLKEEEPIKPDEEPIKLLDSRGNRGVPLKKDKKKVVPLRRKIIVETSNEDTDTDDDEPIIYIRKIKKKMIRPPTPPPEPPQEQHFYKEPQIIRQEPIRPNWDKQLSATFVPLQEPIRPPLRVFTSSMLRR